MLRETPSLDARLQQRLDAHQKAGLIRPRRALDPSPAGSFSRCFSSNDYLGLAKHPKLIKAFQIGAELYGFGTGSSQLVSGHTKAHAQCEEAFAEYLKRDKALLFANGYLANLGIFPALVNPDSATPATLIFDKYNHASLYDGAKLSTAKLQRYPHLEMDSLENLLKKNADLDLFSFIVSEHVFSTDGSQADIPALISLSQKYDAPLIIDDAHGLGVFDFSYSQEEVPILMCPLGKALGGFGGIVAGSSVLIESLIQFSRNYMFSTAPPAAIAHTLSAALALIQEESWRREKLFENIAYFKKTALDLDLNFSPSDHPIQSLILGNPERAVLLKNDLLKAGFDVAIMRPPTVPYAKTLLRVSLSARHEKEDIRLFLERLASFIDTSSGKALNHDSSLPTGETEISRLLAEEISERANSINQKTNIPLSNFSPKAGSSLGRDNSNKRLLKLLLIPGFGFSPESFRPLASALSLRFSIPEIQIECVNLVELFEFPKPSCEESDPAKKFDQLIKSLIPKVTPQTFIIGFSLGGLLALKLNAFAAGVCLISSTPHFIASDDWPGISPQFFLKFEALFKKNPEKALLQFLLLQGPKSGLKNANKDFLLQLQGLIQTPTEGEKDAWEYLLWVLKNIDLRDLELKNPVLAISGDEDILLGELAPTLHSPSKSSSVILQGKGHFLLQDPECFKAVIAFIEKNIEKNA